MLTAKDLILCYGQVQTVLLPNDFFLLVALCSKIGDITTILGFFLLGLNQKPCNSCGEKLSAFFVLRSFWCCNQPKMALKQGLSEIISTFAREPQNRCSCSLTRNRKFLKIHSVQWFPQFAYIFLKNGRTSTDNHHGTLDSKNLHLQPLSRLLPLLHFARIFLPMKHIFSRRSEEEQTSSVQQDLGGCLLVVGLQGEVLIANFLISSFGRSCLAWM